MTVGRLYTIDYECELPHPMGAREAERGVIGRFTAEHDPSGAGKIAFQPTRGDVLWLFADEYTRVTP